MNTENFISLDASNIDKEHICCAFSDKKYSESYQSKKDWLKREFGNGYVFYRLDARAKVFIEYGPAEMSWVPIDAPNYLLINCFWVAGQYKGKGYGKLLLQKAYNDASEQGKCGLVTVAGIKKFHFMSDTTWLLRQGFEITEKTSDGFCLLTKKNQSDAPNPKFKSCVKEGISSKNGLVAYYSNRCPYAEFSVKTFLTETAKNKNIPLEIIKLETKEAAQSAPTPATIFSLFYKGKMLTTDISACIENRLEKLLDKI